MRKEVMELWVEELKSGYWQQGKYFLEHSGFYCVMGVLANIAATQGICSHTGNNIGLFESGMLSLPQEVVEWAELKSEVGEVPSLKYSLVEMNDSGKSFSYLADVIKKHWEVL